LTPYPDPDGCTAAGFLSVAVGLFDLIWRAVEYRRRRQRAKRARRQS
jgi:hypothetical protein